MKPRWRKVCIDLWENKIRTSLVVLSIAVGVFAVGMISDAYLILVKASEETYKSTNPFSAALITSPFDVDLVNTIRKMPEIKDAAGRRVQQMRIHVNEKWYTMDLSALDFDDPRVNLLESTQGSYPPQDRQLLIDETAAAITSITMGDMVLIETPSGKQYEIPITGLVRDMNANPSINSNKINAYCTFDTFEWLGYSKDYNRLLFIVKENENDLLHVQHVTGKVRKKIEGSHYNVLLTTILFQPGQNPTSFIIDAIKIVLGTLAVTSLFLSAFLVYNTITSLVMSQIKHIGIMKSIGACNKDIINIYLMLVMAYGLIAFMVAAPFAAFAANKFSLFIASPSKLDIKLPVYQINPGVLILELVISLFVPMLAALPSVLKNARVTVQKAIASHGLGEVGFRKSVLDKIFKKFHFFSTPWVLAFGNTWRQKSRVGLTLGTLILGGAVFIGVISVRDSSSKTIDEMSEAYKFDIEVKFERPYRLEKILYEALQIPGVIKAEGLGQINSTIINQDGEEGNSVIILAPPGGSEMTHPKILNGRWLLPTDEKGIVIGTDLLRENPDLKVGSEINLKIKGRNYIWVVVGIYRVVGYNVKYEAYANYDYITSLVNQFEETQRIQLITEKHEDDYQKYMASFIENFFHNSGYYVTSIETSSELRGVFVNQFDIIVKVELIMAELIMLVGGLGLAGTMSMNVMERTREIGVMRAIGATDHSILKIILAEGFFIALSSWFAASILGIPIGMILAYSLGIKMMNGPLAYTYSYIGAITWLGLIFIIAFLACFLPAYRASKLTIRDVLAYE